MTRRVELFALLIADAVALFGANLFWHKARFSWGWFSDPVNVPVPSLVWLVALALAGAWLVVFLFFGMYRERYASSRFDEFVSLAKVITIGILVMFFFLFIDQLDAYAARTNLGFYWLALFGLVSVGRFLVRSVQKGLILKGKGLHRAIVVGWDDRLDELYREVAAYPEAGLEIVGSIRLRREGDGAADFDSEISDLPRLIDDLKVQDVLIALGAGDQEPLLEVLRLCDGKAVRLKLVPDFYSVIGGMARTEHMYGLPLIEVMPEPMPAWEQSSKRLLDMVVSGVVIVLGAPIWLVLSLVIRLTSRGKAIYAQRRVGHLGREFTMYKFRTMRDNAEAESGPVWATHGDPRYTPVGRWLRKTRLDEIPQFWNVFKGDMSLVGPRPERPYFVERLAKEIPLYNRRHRVKPGITGWAQVKWKYDTSLDDVRQKVKYDLFYIENLGLRRDLQILFRTITTALRGSGQ
ncbi:MAG: exopolysaccharide biosynthesis polyprenyl glycosylphosphotransferase [Rhodothermales bacterium]|jgi:exopolysaccharide biosynthesis polyprenyl glycosylphosphotransferase